RKVMVDLHVKLPGRVRRKFGLGEVVEAARAGRKGIEINDLRRYRIDHARRDHITLKGSPLVVNDVSVRIHHRSYFSGVVDVNRRAVRVETFGEIARSLQRGRHCPRDRGGTVKPDAVVVKEEEGLLLDD